MQRVVQTVVMRESLVRLLASRDVIDTAIYAEIMAMDAAWRLTDLSWPIDQTPGVTTVYWTLPSKRAKLVLARPMQSLLVEDGIERLIPIAPTPPRKGRRFRFD